MERASDWFDRLFDAGGDYLTLKSQGTVRLGVLKKFIRRALDDLSSHLDEELASQGRVFEKLDARVFVALSERDLLLRAVVGTQFIVENTLKAFLRRRMPSSAKVARMNLSQLQEALMDNVGVSDVSKEWEPSITINCLANCIKHNDARVDERLASIDNQYHAGAEIGLTTSEVLGFIDGGTNTLDWIFGRILDRLKREVDGA